MNWIWVAVPILAIISPFAFLIVKKWMDFRLRLAEAHGASDVARRLADAEAALVASQRRIEKLEAVVVDQLLDAPDPPMAIEEGRGSSRQEKESIL